MAPFASFLVLIKKRFLFCVFDEILSRSELFGIGL